jgi:hypothetical protein
MMAGTTARGLNNAFQTHQRGPPGGRLATRKTTTTLTTAATHADICRRCPPRSASPTPSSTPSCARASPSRRVIAGRSLRLWPPLSATARSVMDSFTARSPRCSENFGIRRFWNAWPARRSGDVRGKARHTRCGFQANIGRAPGCGGRIDRNEPGKSAMGFVRTMAGLNVGVARRSGSVKRSRS